MTGWKIPAKFESMYRKTIFQIWFSKLPNRSLRGSQASKDPNSHGRALKQCHSQLWQPVEKIDTASKENRSDAASQWQSLTFTDKDKDLMIPTITINFDEWYALKS